MPSPSGIRMDQGHATIIEFSGNTTIQLWEKTVKPMGIDGGEPINTTTMRNVTWETMIARSLMTMTPAELECAYDEAVYTAIIAMVNNNQQLTVIFPSLRRITFWGYLRSFEPNPIVMQEQPTARVVVVPTNQNNSGVETGPTIGTTSTTTSTTTTTTAP